MSYIETIQVPTVQLRYFAYNCIEMKLPGGKTLVIDPCLRKTGPFACGYDTEDLEGCDYVLINHSHEDHVGSLAETYDRFHPLIMAHERTAYDLCNLYDIPYIKMVPFSTGDTFDYGCFKVDILRGRHNSTKMFMIRPSGRVDETAIDRMKMMCGRDDLDAKLFGMGTMYDSNFLITLPNNLRIGFFAGNPGMLEPEDTALWSKIRPDIVFAHRCKWTDPKAAETMANVLAVTGARLMMPIHIEDAYSDPYDASEYIANINKVCEEKGIAGRAFFLQRAKWYQFGTIACML